MPSADLTLKIFLILPTILVFGLGSTSEARSIKSWPGFVQAWGGSCGSQYQNCVKQASRFTMHVSRIGEGNAVSIMI